MFKGIQRRIAQSALMAAAGAVLLAVPALADTAAASSDPALATAASLDAAADPIRDLVERHLKALRDGDAASAFSLTSRHVQEKYGSASRFLYTIRSAYAPLHNHLSYTFLDRAQIGDAVLQKVEMIGRKGVPVVALLKLVRDETGAWAVDSYTVLDSSAQPI